MLEYEFCVQELFDLSQHRGKLGPLWAIVLFAAGALYSVIDARAQAPEPMARCWSYSEPVLQAGGLAADETAVYFVDSANTVIALDRRDGTTVWSAELGGTVNSSLIATKSSILVVTRTISDGVKPNASYIRAVSKATGITQWLGPLPNAERYSIRDGGNGIVILENGSEIFGVETDKGQIRWRRSGLLIGDGGQEPASASIATRSESGRIEVVSLVNGQTVDRFEWSATPVAFTSRTDQYFFGDTRGTIESRHAGGGRVWNYKTGGAITQLIVAGDNILAASADNYIYSISIRSGGITWKRKMPGRISSVDLLGSGKAGITVFGEKTAYVVDVGDGRFVEQLDLDGEDEFIGHPLRGDHTFLTALTTRGLTAFSAYCSNEKAAVRSAAASKNLFVGSQQN